MKKRAQASMEYMLVVGFSLLLLMPVIYIYGVEKQSINDRVNSNQAREIIKKVIDASESIYYMGEPSKTTIKVYIPSNIESVGISDNEIVFNVKKGNGVVAQVVGYSPVNMTGNIKTLPGIHLITVQNKGKYVYINSS